MITPEPPAGSEHYREGWRHGYEQAAIDRERSADVSRVRCDWCTGITSLDDEGMVVAHPRPDDGASCPGSHGDDFERVAEQARETGADRTARPRRFSPEDTLSVAERLGAAEPSGDTGRPTVEPSDAWVIGRFTDATAQRGDRTFEMWDDDVHRTSAAALHHHVMHVEDPDPWSWHIYALVRIAAPGSSRDTVQAPTAEIAGWDGAS